MSGQGARPLATHHKGAMSAIAAFFQLAISRVRTSSMPAETSSSTSVPSSSKGRFPQPIAIASRRDGLLKSNHGQMLVPADFRRRLPDGAIVDHWTAADGWPLRRFDWPGDPPSARGSILFQGGRGDIFEKYLETFAHREEACRVGNKCVGRSSYRCAHDY